MNERIKELIEQATESKGFLTAGDSVPPLPVKEFNKEKFAELIVRECDRYVAERFDETEPWMCPGDLLKYFGVKE